MGWGQRCLSIQHGPPTHVVLAAIRCVVMAPTIKMVCVAGSVVGSGGVQKHGGVVRGGLDEVSTGNAAGEKPFHNISC